MATVTNAWLVIKYYIQMKNSAMITLHLAAILDRRMLDDSERNLSSWYSTQQFLPTAEEHLCFSCKAENHLLVLGFKYKIHFSRIEVISQLFVIRHLFLPFTFFYKMSITAITVDILFYQFVCPSVPWSIFFKCYVPSSLSRFFLCLLSIQLKCISTSNKI